MARVTLVVLGLLLFVRAANRLTDALGEQGVPLAGPAVRFDRGLSAAIDFLLAAAVFGVAWGVGH